MTSQKLRYAAVAVSVLLLAAGLVRAASDDYQQRQAEAYKAAMAKRKELGLDGSNAGDKLRQQYPSPEVTFGAGANRDAAFAVVCPGETAKVFIPGKFQPGTTFIVQSNDVKVATEKLTPKGWEATLKVPKNRPPERIRVQIASPVSFIVTTVTALEIRCGLRFKLKLDSGPTLETSLTWKDDSNDYRGAGTWKPGGKVDLSGRGTGEAFSLTQEAKQAEVEDSMNKMQTLLSSPAMQALEKRQEKVMNTLNACSSKPPAQMESCMAGPTKELQAISQERERMMSGGLAPAVGCRSMTLQLKDGQVTGTASECSDGKGHQVTGTFSSP